MNPETDFRARLSGPPLLADGGMGTELYTRGVYVNRCFDELNRSQPELVAAIHRDYIEAGAELIETNTFGANRFKLAPHGLAAEARALSRLGAETARSAADASNAKVWVAGSIGPLGRRLAPLGTMPRGEARAAFAEQAAGLVEGGVDLLVVETMVDAGELGLAVEAVREVTDLPLVAQFTLTDWNEETYGAVIERVVSRLEGLDVDVIGVNCSLGPNKLLEAAQGLMQVTARPVSLMPNAGELEWFEGRLICRATPEYFAEYTKRMAQSGVRIIGGCCGSTPSHIRAMSAALRATAPGESRREPVVIVGGEAAPGAAVAEAPYAELSGMAAALQSGRFLFSVEVNPPRSPALGKLKERVAALKGSGVDLVNIPDGPRASARMSAMVLAYLLREEIGMEPILHYTCRDRNLLGIQSDLLGAEALGLDNILCVTGDPPKLGDYPMATAVFDVDSIGLLRLADNLNHGLDIAGNPVSRQTTFHLGAGVNPGAVDLESELDRLHRKLEQGARYILTQPVFNQERFFKFLDRLNMPNVPFLVGILPLASYRNAEFFHNEVPGMEVPGDIRERLKGAADAAEAAAIGAQAAAEALAACAPRAAGAYIMPPFGRTDLALRVIELFKESGAGRQRLAVGNGGKPVSGKNDSQGI